IPRLHYLSAVKANYLEKIDYGVYSKAELSKIDDLSKQAYGVGAAYFSYVMAFDNEKLPAGKRPTTWAEFWDAKKFPGPRTLRAGVYGTGAYEEALLADGVPMGPRTCEPAGTSSRRGAGSGGPIRPTSGSRSTEARTGTPRPAPAARAISS